MVRANIEGMAYETRLILELLDESIDEKIRELYMYGGSAVNDTWNQAFADITGNVIRVPGTEQTNRSRGRNLCGNGSGLL